MKSKTIPYFLMTSNWAESLLLINSGLLLLSDLASGNLFGDIQMVFGPMWKGQFLAF